MFYLLIQSFVENRSSATSEKRFKFQPELDGPHKYQLLVDLPKKFHCILPAACVETHTTLWTSFFELYTSLRKVL